MGTRGMGFKSRQTCRPLSPCAAICILALLSSKGGGCSSPARGGHDHQQPPGSSPSPEKEHLSPTSCRFNAPQGGAGSGGLPCKDCGPGGRDEREDSPIRGPHGWSRGTKGRCIKEEEAGRRHSDPGCKLQRRPSSLWGRNTWEGSVIS